MAYLVKPFSREAALNALRLGLEWRQMSLAIRGKKNDRSDSIETWLATPPNPEVIAHAPGDRTVSPFQRRMARHLAPWAG